MGWRRFVMAVAALASLSASEAWASPAEKQIFEVWLQDLRTEALGKGIKEDTLNKALADVRPIPRVLELDKKQPEFKLSLAKYLQQVVPKARIQAAQGKLAAHAALLKEISGKYRVPSRFIVALWGVETDFGRVTGSFPVVAALATLAYDGRRSAFFRSELLNALTILDQGHIAPEKMKGSWAGAMGQSQFMPSSFLRFAEDYNGDGHKDIWGTEADVFASIANYLSKSGWKEDQTWGMSVRLPKKFDEKLADPKIRKTLAEWNALGVRQGNGQPLPVPKAKGTLSASVLLPEGKGGRAFLVHGNFETILKWNRSNLFAIAVGQLADGVGGR
ncbi:MAG: lytic murein transglycosylase [Alphaproteobacteria bacterium]|nr:lytic murein transglycosylase [Alphaproteobacteria bacterium]MBF0129258.1 lytic murein transglycosylase [Alphaproteobacteria bacterium]